MLLGLLWILTTSIIVKVLGSCYKSCESCHETHPDALNVHIVPHTHLDVGWIKTFEEYYWGTKAHINKSGVRYIIESVIVALMENPQRRFILAEAAYLHKWWNTTDDTSKNKIIQLINSGQLEIVGGGWTMNDEACTNYQAIIDQFTLGLKFLKETFGPCAIPKVAWQIDPFGHSREMGFILTQVGYDAIFIGRLDHQDRQKRFNSKTAEMIWQTSSSSNANIFVSILFDGYMSPHFFCFDSLCNDEPIVDDLSNPEYNVDIIVARFAEYVKVAANCYSSNHLLIPMGGDFHFQNALHHFSNLDKLINGFKVFNHTYRGHPINLIYSTPNCYLKAINQWAVLQNQCYTQKFDDFFPYASDAFSFWTGFYTSRPNSKRFERDSNNILQVTKQLTSFVPQIDDEISNLKPMQEALAIMQHHDAITGTEKQHVANDYHKLLTMAFQKNIEQTSDMLSILLPKNPLKDVDLNLNYCLYANVSICKLTQNDEDFIVAVYNPLSSPISHYIRLPASSGCFSISDSDDNQIIFDIFPTIDDFIEYEKYKPAKYELVFHAKNLPPLGVKLYTFEKNYDYCKKCVEPDISQNRYSLGNDINGFEVDKSTGLLCNATLNGDTISLEQEFLYYTSVRGDNSVPFERASGAYIFRPTLDATKFFNRVQTKTYKGKLIHELHQIINPWVKQIVRVYKNANYLEFDWLIGPIDISDYEGKEIISRFKTELNSNDVFYTDSNGREMIKRRRDFRSTFRLITLEHISSNYYPVTSKISLKDKERNFEFAIITDRTQGGSSLSSGEVELMIHRRILNDDGLGVDEVLNEREFGKGKVVRGKHYVTFSPIFAKKFKCKSAVTQKSLVQRQLMSPLPSIMESTNLQTSLWKKFSGLTQPLPKNIQILTLEPWKSSENKILLRLEHVYEANEDEFLSQPVTVCLDGLFVYFDIVHIKEMTLGANIPLNCNKKLLWNIENNIKGVTYPLYNWMKRNKNHVLESNYNVELFPMDIRTFILTVTYK